MRDAHLIRERVVSGFSDYRPIFLSLVGVLALGATFAAGFAVGRRAERLEVPKAEATAQNAELPPAEKLKFYDQLAGKTAAQDPPPPAIAANKPAAPAVVEKLHGPAQPGEYTVQVSAFQTRAEAKAFSAALERKGFAPFVVSAEVPAKGTWYRVRIGRFADEDQAKQAKGMLAKADIPAWVLRSE